MMHTIRIAQDVAENIDKRGHNPPHHQCIKQIEKSVLNTVIDRKKLCYNQDMFTLTIGDNIQLNKSVLGLCSNHTHALQAVTKCFALRNVDR